MWASAVDSVRDVKPGEWGPSSQSKAKQGCSEPRIGGRLQWGSDELFPSPWEGLSLVPDFSVDTVIFIWMERIWKGNIFVKQTKRVLTFWKAVFVWGNAFYIFAVHNAPPSPLPLFSLLPDHVFPGAFSVFLCYLTEFCYFSCWRCLDAGKCEV